MTFSTLVALRNLKRRPKRTLFLILGLALANALTIWILSFRESSSRIMLENILGMKYGNQQLTAQGYYNFEKGSINPGRMFPVSALNGQPDIYTVRTQSIVLMASEKNALPVLMNGYDMRRELALSRMGTVLRNFEFSSKFGLILGRRIAEALSVNVGDELAVIGQGIDGSVANELFKVELILDLGAGDFEKTFAVTSLEAMREFLVMPETHAHLAVNFGTPLEKAPPGLWLVPWQNLLPEIASSSSFMNKFTRFYAIVFAIVASLAMANTMSLSFLERVKEYRMTTIIGAPIMWLRKTIELEIIIVSGLSLVLGNLFILFVFFIVSFYPVDLTILTGGAPIQMGGMVLTQDITVRVEAWIFIVTNVFFVIMLALASLYPLNVVMKKCQVS